MQVTFFKYLISTSLPIFKKNEKIIINTINPHSFYVAENDKIFKNALLESNFLVPDGLGVVLVLKFFKKIKIQRITGWDIHQFYLQYANAKCLKVFYMGSSEETLFYIEKKINKNYPNIIVQTFSPPYKDSFSKKENDFIINLINDFQPNILFVGMTAPRQEKWVYSNKERLSANIICSIGAVFDFFAGTQKRAGRLWLKFNLEWLYRLLNNPFRLYKRTFISLPQFLFYTLLNKKKI